MRETLISDIAGLNPGTLIELFEIDLSTGTADSSVDKFRWINGGGDSSVNGVVWQGNRYNALPIQATGFEFSGKGSIPRPVLTVSNITSLMSGVLREYSDLIGAKVTRRKTLVKYLDSYCVVEGLNVGGRCVNEAPGSCSVAGEVTEVECIVAGGVWTSEYGASTSKDDCTDPNKNGGEGVWLPYTESNCRYGMGPQGTLFVESPLADDTAHFQDEIWYIDRKSVETATHVEFELSASHDISGVKIPVRTVVANLCPWSYKGGDGCSWVPENRVIPAEGAEAIALLAHTQVASLNGGYAEPTSQSTTELTFEGGDLGFNGVAATGSFYWGEQASILKVRLDTPGSGYRSSPTWKAVVDGETVGSGTCSLVETSLEGVQILKGGANYGTSPTITVSAPTTANGVTATYTAVVSNTFTITHAIQVHPGSGYIDVPDVVIGPSSLTRNVYVNKQDQYTSNSSEDSCSKTFSACERRFGYRTGNTGEIANNELPFGGFPGAGIRMGAAQ